MGEGGKGWHSRCYDFYNYKNMITFAYQARDASGRIVTGIQDAINEDNAVTSLMNRGLMVLSLSKKSDAVEDHAKRTDRLKKPTRFCSPGSLPP